MSAFQFLLQQDTKMKPMGTVKRLFPSLPFCTKKKEEENAQLQNAFGSIPKADPILNVERTLSNRGSHGR
jgi:hypothetical protein